MDDSVALDALENALTGLAEQPYDEELHLKHIRAAKNLSPEDLASALEMAIAYIPLGDEEWTLFLDEKRNSLDLDTAEGALQMMEAFTRAEADYLSIPILKSHLHFLIECHTKASLSTSEGSLGELFDTESTRAFLANVFEQGAPHLSQSFELFDVLKEWELELLEKLPPNDRFSSLEAIDEMFLSRLEQPHSHHEETFQAYSTFTTQYHPPEEYETRMVAATKIRAQAVKSLDRRDAHEIAVNQGSGTAQAWVKYIDYERRSKYPDPFVIRGVFERAISTLGKEKSQTPTDKAIEATLVDFWCQYADSARIIAGDVGPEDKILKRAVRSVYSSGEVWSRYLRYLEREERSERVNEVTETITAAFNRALASGSIQSQIEQLVPLVMARISYSKRRTELGDEDSDLPLPQVLEEMLKLTHDKSLASFDTGFRTEKLAAEIYLNLLEMPAKAIDVWSEATKRHKSSYVAWGQYTDLLIKLGQLDKARQAFSEATPKKMDWPEAVWDAWISFENLYGSVEDLEACLDKIDRARRFVAVQRAKEAEAQQAAYYAMQQASNAEPAASQTQASDIAMEIDTDGATRGKRKAEDENPSDSHKRVKIDAAPPLKRDRENCTVLVSSLPRDVEDADLIAIFRDCGEVKEVKITVLEAATVATVEFSDRDSIPGALTKDKKRIREDEIKVNLAWKSTLYVTNFPETADDAIIRGLFAPFGTIFDVRWPSKKFKSTRRFCYVQFVDPGSAQKSLILHGRELEPGRAISVLISNPERKKERSDIGADEKEIYVAGLSKFTTQADLKQLFKTYGFVKDVRIALDENKHCKGYAFVEYEEEADANAALAANNHELKKRNISVTKSNSRVKAKEKMSNETGFGKKTDLESRSVRLRNVPSATQEGLLQQFLEKIAPIKRVELFLPINQAVVEFETTAEAGKFLLRTEPLDFEGSELTIHAETKTTTTKAPSAPVKSGGLFVPRTAGKSKSQTVPPKPAATARRIPPNTRSSGAASQDKFRAMLDGK